MASVIALSGQKTVTTAGTAVQLPSTNPGVYEIGYLPWNAGSYVYTGNDGSTTGDVTSANSFVLTSTLASILVSVTNLNQIWIDADTDGDGVCWRRVAGEAINITPPAA